MATPHTAPDPWLATQVATRMATRFAGDREPGMGNPASRAIGRRIDLQQHELFVVCAPADALRLQFEHLTPEYLALHDLAGDLALELLQAGAAATGQSLQSLVLRRQGFGDALATLQFIELPGPAGHAPLRVYATRALQCEPGEAQRLAQTLLGHSRFGVLLAGSRSSALPALSSVLDRTGEAAWRNRELLILPMAGESVSAIPSLSMPLGLVLHQGAVCVGSRAAWFSLATLWNQHHPADPIALPAPATAPLPTAAAYQPTQVMPLSELPAARLPPVPLVSPPVLAAPAVVAPALAAPISPVAAGVSTEASPTFDAMVQALASLPGFISACVFQLSTQRALAHAGSKPGPASMAARGAELFVTLQRAAQRMGLSPGQPDLSVGFAEQHVVLHPLPSTQGIYLHALFEAKLANPMLIRARLLRTDHPH